MSVHQCFIDDIGEVHDEILMIDDNVNTKLSNFAAIAGKHEICRGSSNS